MTVKSYSWQHFESEATAISSAAVRLLALNEVAFLATVSATNKPRVHPFVPRIVRGELVAFIMDSSPKLRDLTNNGYFAIHTLPGPEDEEIYLTGRATNIDADLSFRDQAAEAMGFATGVDEHHILFSFQLERALWTRWLDFGTPDHRPEYQKWSAD